MGDGYAYCEDCGWETSAESTEERVRRVLEHAIETEHNIVSSHRQESSRPIDEIAPPQRQ